MGGHRGLVGGRVRPPAARHLAPVALFRGLQRLEKASEAVCDGSRGRLLARAGERVRQALDLEHWAAFGASLDALEGLLERVSAGTHGSRPGSVVLLSGDVHHAYLLRARFGDDDGAGRGRAPVYQAVCSPFRNALDARERRAVRMAISPAGAAAGAALARLARAPAERVRWERVGEGPWFDNQIGTLVLDGREAVVALDRAVGPPEGPPRLERIAELD